MRGAAGCGTFDRRIDVWDGAFADLGPLLDRADVLSKAERRDIDTARAGRVRDARRLSRIAQRLALGRTLGVSPAGLTLHRGAYGKPYLPGGAEFSVSHTESHLVIAIGDRRPVGVDVERLRPLPDRESIARIAFTEHEREALDLIVATGSASGEPACSSAAAEASRAVLAGWTRKEALLKAVGLGVGRHLLDIEVRLSADCDDALLSSSLRNARTDDWRVLAFDELPGLVGAIAVRSRVPPNIRRRSLVDLFRKQWVRDAFGKPDEAGRIA